MLHTRPVIISLVIAASLELKLNDIDKVLDENS